MLAPSGGRLARVAKLANALGLGSSASRLRGSIPLPSTMAKQLEDCKVWLIVDARGRAYGLPGGVVFYSWSEADAALQRAKAENALPVKGLRVQPFETPKIRRRHEK